MDRRTVALDSLKAWDENPRFISQARLEELARAIDASPTMESARPLVALPDGTVFMGNQRLRALRHLGRETAEVAFVDLPRSKVITWALRDNQNYGEWEDVALAEWLYEMREAGQDISMLGLSESRVDSLLELVGSGDDWSGGVHPSADPPDSLRVLFGKYRVIIPRVQFDRWYSAVTAKVGEDRDAIVAEILRRLDIEEYA